MYIGANWILFAFFICNAMIEYCKDNTTLRKSLDTASHFNYTYLSTTQYWLTKIYTNKSLYDTYHLIYNYASSLNFNEFFRSNKSYLCSS